MARLLVNYGGKPISIIQTLIDHNHPFQWTLDLDIIWPHDQQIPKHEIWSDLGQAAGSDHVIIEFHIDHK